MPAGGDRTQPFTITVFGRIIEQATCNIAGPAFCQFTYTEGTEGAVITTPESTEFKNG